MGFESQFPGSARGVDTTGVLLKTHAILSQFGITQTSCHSVLVCTNIFSLLSIKLCIFIQEALDKLMVHGS